MNDTQTTDAQALNALILRIATHRDRQAFIALFEATSAKLNAYAIRCGASPSDAEEIVQESLLTVWRKADSFNPAAASANTWLYTIVRNRRIDFVRRNKRHQAQSDDLWPETESEPIEPQLISDLDGRLLRTLFHQLPVEQRQIVYSVYFDGKSHSEIAEEMNLPLGTIKSRLRLGMKKLEILAKERQMLWLITILLTNF